MINPNTPVLGCAEEVEVWITAADLETYAAQLPWSHLSCSMVLDEVSEATVQIPDALGGLRCTIAFGDDLRPWRYGIRIERNGVPVWAGPIVSIERPTNDAGAADYVEIYACDEMVRTQKRTTPDYLAFQDEDAGAVFRAVLDAGMASWNPAGLDCPDFETGFTMTREVVPLDFEYTYDILSEIADSAVDYFMWANELCVYDTLDFGWFVLRDGVKRRIAPTTDTFGRYIYGLFTTESFISRPGFKLDGMAQGNEIWVPGADSGEAGFRRYWTASDIDPLDGPLVHVDVSPLYRPSADGVIISDAVFQQRADSVLELRKSAVAIVSGGTLAQSAPVRVQDLFPGSIWAIDLGETGLGDLVTVQRLKRVDIEISVAESGFTETVTPTLIPLGSDESVIG
jgi:hypothetical protein